MSRLVIKSCIILVRLFLWIAVCRCPGKLIITLNQAPDPFWILGFIYHSNTNVLPYENDKNMVKDCRNYGKTQTGLMICWMPKGYISRIRQMIILG